MEAMQKASEIVARHGKYRRALLLAGKQLCWVTADTSMVDALIIFELLDHDLQIPDWWEFLDLIHPRYSEIGLKMDITCPPIVKKILKYNYLLKKADKLWGLAEKNERLNDTARACDYFIESLETFFEALKYSWLQYITLDQLIVRSSVAGLKEFLKSIPAAKAEIEKLDVIDQKRANQKILSQYALVKLELALFREYMKNVCGTGKELDQIKLTDVSRVSPAYRK